MIRRPFLSYGCDVPKVQLRVLSHIHAGTALDPRYTLENT